MSTVAAGPGGKEGDRPGRVQPHVRVGSGIPQDGVELAQGFRSDRHQGGTGLPPKRSDRQHREEHRDEPRAQDLPHGLHDGDAGVDLAGVRESNQEVAVDRARAVADRARQGEPLVVGAGHGELVDPLPGPLTDVSADKRDETDERGRRNDRGGILGEAKVEVRSRADRPGVRAQGGRAHLGVWVLQEQPQDGEEILPSRQAEQLERAQDHRA